MKVGGEILVREKGLQGEDTWQDNGMWILTEYMVCLNENVMMKPITTCDECTCTNKVLAMLSEEYSNTLEQLTGPTHLPFRWQ